MTQRSIWIVQNAFEKQSKLLRDSNVFRNKEKCVELLCNILSLNYPQNDGQITCTWSRDMKWQRYSSINECWEYHRYHVSNKEVFRKMWITKKELYLESVKHRWNFWDTMKYVTVYLEGKRNRLKQQITYLTSLYNWMTKQGKKLLRVTNG